MQESDIRKVDQHDQQMLEHSGVGIGEGSELSRQITVALSPEQYERLFFQPSAPRRGDLAKRFGMTFYLFADISPSLTSSQVTRHFLV